MPDRQGGGHEISPFWQMALRARALRLAKLIELRADDTLIKSEFLQMVDVVLNAVDATAGDKHTRST